MIGNKGIILGSTVWLLNAAFTIGASSAALRFQSYPILLTSTFIIILIDWLWKEATNTKPESWESGVMQHQSNNPKNALT